MPRSASEEVIREWQQRIDKQKASGLSIQKWCQDNDVTNHSFYYWKIGYFSGLIPYLKNYTTHPFARMDNNTAERAIRPLAIGRKNWLFFGSPQGGEAGAVLFSLVQTCRSIGINPREYLEDVFERLLDHSANKLHELLPDQWKLKYTAITEA